MNDTVVYFKLDAAGDLHVMSDGHCRGCSNKPASCPEPSCGGLIHSEEWMEGDELGPYSCGATVCDSCGDFEVVQVELQAAPKRAYI